MATYMPAVMSYPWQMYTIHQDTKITPGEFALCVEIKIIPGELEKWFVRDKNSKIRKNPNFF
jgi:hypothetical protein